MRMLPRPFSFSAKSWIITFIALIVVLFVYYVLQDNYTPHTSDAFIQNYVVQVAPQVEGRVIRVDVADGSLVKKDTPLFQIDPRPFDYRVSRLQARLVQTTQQVAALGSALDAAGELIEQRKADLADAQEYFDQVKPLARKGDVAQRALQEATDRLSSARALLHQAQADRQSIEQKLAAKVDGEHASIKEAEADLATAKLQQEWSTVRAPADGYVTNLQLAVGTYVEVGQPVMTFIDSHGWWVVANFKENALRRIHPDQPAEIGVPMDPGSVFQARVESIGWGVGEGQGSPSGNLPAAQNPQDWIKLAQRFPVRLRFTDLPPDYPLRVGASAAVTVYTSDSAVLNALGGLWLRIGSYLSYVY